MELAGREKLYQRTGLPLALIGAFLIPIKLAVAYAAIVPLILLWASTRDWKRPSLPPLLLPLALFIAIALVSSLFGIQPFRSLPKFLNLTFFSLSILAFADIGRRHGVERIMFASLWGASAAAINAIAQGASFMQVPRFFLGAMTQSGQLAVQIPVALGLATWYAYSELPAGRSLRFGCYFRSPPVLLTGGVNFALACAIGFSEALELPLSAKFGLGAALLSGVIVAAALARNTTRRNVTLVMGIILPLLVAALLVNLKRGPWLGAFAGVSVFLFIYARALILPLIAVLLGTLVLFEPIRSRAALSADHFFIMGGRNVMWQIGTELITRFPLGIGYHNSRFLRHFSMEIPPQHNHFHSNFLNILVETGWLGFAAFMWWIGRLLSRGFSGRDWNRSDILGCALGCAVLSWQIAGVVEYSFGDSEVVNLVWVMLGTLFALRSPAPAAETPADAAQIAQPA